MPDDLPFIEVTRRSGDERFVGTRIPDELTLLNFWQWSASDLVSNVTRGVLAEYIVAAALGLHNGVRREWDAWDLETETGLRIEVKAAAYVQSWFQKRPSRIVYNIRPTHAWDYRTNVLGKSKTRHADLYVFALLHHKDKRTVNPLDLSQWTFFVLKTDVLAQSCPTAETIRLSSLVKTGAVECRWGELKATVEQAASRIELMEQWNIGTDPIIARRDGRKVAAEEQENRVRPY